MRPVSIDASEAGEQVLSAALALSLATGCAFRLRHFRGASSVPGVRPPQLALLRAAAAVCGQRNPALDVGTRELCFPADEGPAAVRAGDYLLEVGAGVSVPTVLACLLPALALAGGGSLTLRGGTHLPEGPHYHALALVWLTALRAYGFDADLRLRSAGFAPEGAGEVRAIVPAYRGEPPALVELLARGTLVEVHVTSLVAGTALALAERQARGAELVLRERGIPCITESLPLPSARAQGSAVLVRAQFENTVAAFSAVAAPGEPPEAAGRRAAAGLCELMEGPGALDPATAEQLLVPAALLASGRLGPSTPGTTRYQAPASTPALRAVAAAVQALLPVRVTVGSDGAVAVSPGS
ncbi:MAG: RNA 3'-terminal phosphate cyclase [Myxococcaceae bacterium]|nr:RNA 3'-terminal phosphate cyclase [Myxococcaceae bacterium]MCI0669069.1 RNA 3'-terminal phosphate cyclase [Myxococcaceae bacterium]